MTDKKKEQWRTKTERGVTVRSAEGKPVRFPVTERMSKQNLPRGQMQVISPPKNVPERKPSDLITDAEVENEEEDLENEIAQAVENEDAEALDRITERYRILSARVKERDAYLPKSRSEKLNLGIRKLGESVAEMVRTVEEATREEGDQEGNGDKE